MKKFSYESRTFEVECMSSTLYHCDIRITHIWKTFVVKPLVVQNFPLEGFFTVYQESRSFESASRLVPIDVFLILVDCP